MNYAGSDNIMPYKDKEKQKEYNRECSKRYRKSHLVEVYERNKIFYDKRKRNRACTKCGKKVKIGHTQCWSCLFKSSIYSKKYFREHFDSVTKRHHANRLLWIRTNKCARCGAPLIEDETKYCMACRSYWGTRTGIGGVLKYEIAN